MKRLFSITACLLCFTIYSKGQANNPPSDTIKVLLENEKMKVTEYSSSPGKDVCGKGKHTHAPHLTILLTDAVVKLTTVEGKVKDYDLKSGTTIWSEAETHMAINNGTKPAKVYLVELK